MRRRTFLKTSAAISAAPLVSCAKPKPRLPADTLARITPALRPYLWDAYLYADAGAAARMAAEISRLEPPAGPPSFARAAQFLRQRLQSLDLKDEASPVPAVLASDPGTEPGAVLLAACWREPGLPPDASGLALAAGCAAVLRDVKRKKGKERFRRGYRLYLGLDQTGVLALPARRPDFLHGVKAMLELGGVGPGGGPLRANPPLLAAGSFGPFLFRRLLDDTAKITGYRPADGPAFRPGCTVLNDPVLAGIPSCQLARDRTGAGGAPDPAAPDTALLAASAWVYFWAEAGVEEAEWLMEEYFAGMEDTLARGAAADTEIYLALKEVELYSLLNILPRENHMDFTGQIGAFMGRLRKGNHPARAIMPAGGPAEVAESMKLTPKAVLSGPAAESYYTAAALEKLQQDPLPLALRAWADGSRSVYDICRHAIFEMPLRREQLNLDFVLEFFRIYAKNGLVEFKESGEVEKLKRGEVIRGKRRGASIL